MSRRRSELEAILSGISPDTLIVITPDRNITMCNHSVFRMFGRTPEQLLGRSTEELYHDRRKYTVEPHAIKTQLELDGFHVGQAMGIRASGEDFPLEIITGTLADRGGAVLLLRDVTHRVREEDERRRLQEQVARQEHMKSLGILAGGIAHDFNNLLAGVLGNADFIQHSLEADSPHREPFAEIIRAANRASVLCRDMLAYAGRGQIHIEPLRLGDIVHDMRQFLRQSIFKGINLMTELDESAPATEGDLSQIRQILMNLVSNASDAIGDKQGGITIATGRCECDKDRLDRCLFHFDARPGTYVFLKVTDTGSGMDESIRRSIFEPFFTTKSTGHGLGLASAQGVMRSHRGALDVESRPGRGSAFTAYFPATDKPLPPPAAAPTDDRLAAGSGVALIVDDEAVVARIAERMLTKLGYSTISATTGRSALSLFQENAGKFRFVLLDMTMPDMNGREVFLELRRIRPDVPIVLSSGYGRDDIEALFKSENPSGFIQKPYHMADLNRVVRQALDAG